MMRSSYYNMITKMMLTGISETQYPMLANGPLTDNEAKGITKLAAALVKKYSSYMAEEGPIIWDEIAKIKTYVEKRNTIDEKKMYTEEESKRLLKTTEDVQKILEHISKQEENFIELSDIVNNNIYHIFNSYIEKAGECEDAAKEITEKVAEQMNPTLSSTRNSEEEIFKTTSLIMLEDCIKEMQIQNGIDGDILTIGQKHLDPDTFDGFTLLQCWVALCYRFNVYRMNTFDNQTKLDLDDMMKKLIAEKDRLSSILDLNQIEQDFQIEQVDKLNSLKKDLTDNLNINEDYTKNLINELDELISLTAQREPKEVDDLQAEAEGEQTAEQ